MFHNGIGEHAGQAHTLIPEIVLSNVGLNLLIRLLHSHRPNNDTELRGNEPDGQLLADAQYRMCGCTSGNFRLPCTQKSEFVQRC